MEIYAITTTNIIFLKIEIKLSLIMQINITLHFTMRRKRAITRCFENEWRRKYYNFTCSNWKHCMYETAKFSLRVKHCDYHPKNIYEIEFGQNSFAIVSFTSQKEILCGNAKYIDVDVLWNMYKNIKPMSGELKQYTIWHFQQLKQQYIEYNYAKLLLAWMLEYFWNNKDLAEDVGVAGCVFADEYLVSLITKY